MTATPIVQADGIVRRDPLHGTTLLHSTTFALQGGDQVAITGPSGSGKSVLLRALALLDPLDGGRIRWHGNPVERTAIPRYRRAIAYIRQRPAVLDGTVEDNLRYPFSLNVYRDVQFDRAHAAALAAHAGRGAGFLEQQASELSGGEAQIVALIRVLQLAPEVLLLDEPSASLDPESTVCDRSPHPRVVRWRTDPARMGLGIARCRAGRAHRQASVDDARGRARRAGRHAGRARHPQGAHAMSLQDLSLWDVGIAALLIVVNGALSIALKLDLERRLAWAGLRTIVQLLAIGYVLGWVFSYARWYIVLPLMIVMTLIAGFAGAQRGTRTYAGQRVDSVLSIWVSTWLVAAVGLFASYGFIRGTSRNMQFRFSG